MRELPDLEFPSCFMNVANLLELDSSVVFETQEDLNGFVAKLNDQFGEDVYRLVSEKESV